VTQGKVKSFAGSLSCCLLSVMTTVVGVVGLYKSTETLLCVNLFVVVMLPLNLSCISGAVKDCRALGPLIKINLYKTLVEK